MRQTSGRYMCADPAAESLLSRCMDGDALHLEDEADFRQLRELEEQRLRLDAEERELVRELRALTQRASEIEVVRREIGHRAGAIGRRLAERQRRHVSGHRAMSATLDEQITITTKHTRMHAV